LFYHQVNPIFARFLIRIKINIMHNNGLIKFFAFCFTLVSVYQISFTFITSNVEDKASQYSINAISDSNENYADLREEKYNNYLDSISNESILGFTSYKGAKDKELNKGLDLKGGIDVTLQVSVKDILKGLAEYSKDPVFNKALNDADALQKESDDTYVESFFEAFEKIQGETTLASPDIFANRSLSDEINFEMSDSEVKPIIRRKIDESIVSAFEVLRKRIDKFGVTQPNIQRLGNSGRIRVELPGAKDVARVKNLLQSTAQLEFWYTETNDQFLPFLSQANETLKNLLDDEEIETESDESSEIDDLLADVEANDSISNQKNPLFDYLVGTGYQGGPVIAQFLAKDQNKIEEFLSMPEIRQLLPSEKRYTRFLFGKPDVTNNVVDLYAIQSNRDNKPPLGGSVVVDASQSYDQVGAPAVSMQMNGKGARKWEEMTGKAYKDKSNIAIVLDDIVYSAPGVSRGAISGGRSEISGQFTLNEAIDLANVLRAGKLPASAEIIESEVVGPSLGKENIEKGINSFIIALIMVLIWMIFYYGRAGLFADVALVLNLVLIFGILAGLGAVLTLPGIAGIVLTIGMSVDANVLIFERIREELNKGKGLKQSVGDGFSNALSSILDANITTGLTALILFVFGSGPIKGFATTLLIGIATSLFTAIFITRMLVDSRLSKGKILDFSTTLTKNLFNNLSIRFLQKRRVAYFVSASLLLISLYSLSTNGLNQGVDFVGGRTYTVRFDNDVNQSEIQASLIDVLGNAEAKTFGSDNQLKITTNYKVDVEGIEVDDEIQLKMFDALKSVLPSNLTYDDFVNGADDKSVGIMGSSKVGPTIADDIKKNSFLAIFGSLVVVFLYILLRFRDWQYSLGAVTAVFHDVLIVSGDIFFNVFIYAF
jgi:SecD/SecF fusion protein